MSATIQVGGASGASSLYLLRGRRRSPRCERPAGSRPELQKEHVTARNGDLTSFSGEQTHRRVAGRCCSAGTPPSEMGRRSAAEAPPPPVGERKRKPKTEVQREAAASSWLTHRRGRSLFDFYLFDPTAVALGLAATPLQLPAALFLACLLGNHQTWSRKCKNSQSGEGSESSLLTLLNKLL